VTSAFGGQDRTAVSCGFPLAFPRLFPAIGALERLTAYFGGVYLHAWKTGSELRDGLARWIGFYNAHRPQIRNPSNWRHKTNLGIA
jgi:hypothetical protein